MKKIVEKRNWLQGLFTLLSNGYLKGFLEGNVYKGPLKQFCLPGLNCYSCPGALGACPIGALQAVLAKRGYFFSYYVVGALLLVGVCFGRFVCGWLCPFGLAQDLIYKIPFMKKNKKMPLDGLLIWFKYVILIVFVVVLPLFWTDFAGQGLPWFCQYICPSGMLMGGLPLYVLNNGIREAAGLLFFYKFSILLLVLLLSVLYFRPFCRYICPLGAIYGLLNSVALSRFQIHERCTGCGKCKAVCKMDIAVNRTPNHSLCIRCGDCISVCPTHAVEIRCLKAIRKKKSVI